MTPSHTIDVSALPDYDISSNSPLWWGQVLMATIEGTMFLIMIAIYFYTRLGFSVWPPPGTQLPHLGLETIGLVPLALSCAGSYWASEGAKKDRWGQMIIGLIGNLVPALIFLGLRGWEMASFNFGWSTDIFGSIVWTILFLHTFDAVADLIFTAVLIAVLLTGRYGAMQRLGVHVDSIVWYFIALIWIPLYVVVYWGPRIVGAP